MPANRRANSLSFGAAGMRSALVLCCGFVLLGAGASASAQPSEFGAKISASSPTVSKWTQASDNRPHFGIARTKWLTPEDYNKLVGELPEEKLPEYRAAGDIGIERDDQAAAGDLPAALKSAQACMAAYRKLWGNQNPFTAHAIARCAELHHQNGHADAARTLYEEALSIFQKLRGVDHPVTITLQIEIANLDHDVGHLKEAIDRYQRAVDAIQQSSVATKLDVAIVLAGQAALYRDAGYPQLALDAMEQGTALLRKELPDSPQLAQSEDVLGTLYLAMARLDDAEATFRRSLAIYDADPSPYPLQRAWCHSNLGNVLRQRNRLRDALTEIEEAKSILKQSVGENHPAFATVLLEHAAFAHSIGNSREAEKLTRDAARIINDAFGPGHPQNAIVLRNLGVFLAERGKLTDAETSLSDALELVRNTVGDQHPLIAQIMQDLAQVEEARDNHQLAKQLTQLAASAALQYLGKEHPEYAQHMIRAAQVYQDVKEYGLAEAALKQAQDVVADRLGEKHPEYAKVLSELGTVYGALQQRDEGKSLAKAAGKILVDRLGPDHPEVAKAAVHLADLYAADSPEQAEAILRRATDDLAVSLSPKDRERLEGLLKLGDICLSLQKPEDAKEALDEAIELMGDELARESPLYRKAIKKLAEVERVMNQVDRAIELEQEWEELAKTAASGPNDDRIRAFFEIAERIEDQRKR
jgi:tetratricopeptide (TPR) repeat protein